MKFDMYTVDRALWVMHDSMPYDLIQGQGQDYQCFKATQEESTVSATRDYFFDNSLYLGLRRVYCRQYNKMNHF